MAKKTGNTVKDDPSFPDLTKLGEAVTFVRKDRGKTMVEVAGEIGCGKNLVWEIEKGKPVARERYGQIAKSLQCKTETAQGIIDEVEIIKSQRKESGFEELPKNLEHYGASVNIVRLAKKLEQQQLADKVVELSNGEITCSDTTIGRIERLDPQQPKVKDIYYRLVAKALGHEKMQGVIDEAGEIIAKQKITQEAAERRAAEIARTKTAPSPVFVAKKSGGKELKKPDFTTTDDSPIDGYSHAELWRIINRHMISKGMDPKTLGEIIGVPAKIIVQAKKPNTPEKEQIFLSEKYLRKIPDVFGQIDFAGLAQEEQKMPVMSHKNIMDAIDHHAQTMHMDPEEVMAGAGFDINDTQGKITAKQAYVIATVTFGFDSIADMINKARIVDSKPKTPPSTGGAPSDDADKAGKDKWKNKIAREENSAGWARGWKDPK